MNSDSDKISKAPVNLDDPKVLHSFIAAMSSQRTISPITHVDGTQDHGNSESSTGAETATLDPELTTPPITVAPTSDDVLSQGTTATAPNVTKAVSTIVSTSPGSSVEAETVGEGANPSPNVP